MNNGWLVTTWRTLGVLGGATLVGLWFGQAMLGLLCGALVCLGWHLWQLYRLQRWLSKADWSQLPEVGGAWGDIYLRFIRLRQRNRKRKRKLSRLLKRFQQAVTALPDGMITLNENNQVIWFNKAAQRLLGLRMPHDLDLHITMLVRHPSFVAFLAADSAAGSVDIPAPQNSLLQLRLRMVPYGKKERLLIATDVSQAQRLEQMRRDFVANVSHELRTPLTVISGYLESLTDDVEITNPRWQQPVEHMQQQTTRMLHIVADLLLLSRLESEIEPRTRRPVAVPDMLATIALDAVTLSGDKQVINMQTDDELWLSGAEQELRSAFSNLVFNAVQHTPSGCEITIRWYADEQGLHFAVVDNGPGIPSQHLPRLSERFYRVDRSRQRGSGERNGTGLGLAIVKHVLQRHGGELNIESELGIGSTFRCDFPAHLRTPKLTVVAKTG